MPWESIVTNYFSVGDNDSESVVSEVVPAPAPAPPAASTVKFAETSDTEDDDDDSDSDSEPPKIQLTEEAVDLDGIADLDEKEEVVDIKVPETTEASLVLKL